MRCPFCAADSTRVVDSRPAEEGLVTRRRRSCSACDRRFTTYERFEAPMVVRKRDGSIEDYDASKIRTGIERALGDRRLAGDLDAVVTAVRGAIEAPGRQIESDAIGRAVLDELRSIDEVAYLRFASVYKDFRDAGDFEREMAEMEAQPAG